MGQLARAIRSPIGERRGAASVHALTLLELEHFCPKAPTICAVFIGRLPDRALNLGFMRFCLNLALILPYLRCVKSVEWNPLRRHEASYRL